MDFPPCKMDHAHAAHLLDDVFRMVARKCPEVTDWLCPITGQLMTEPTTAEDRFNYERTAITEWLDKGSVVSPQTKEEMGKKLEANTRLAKIIQDFTAFVFGEGEELTLEWQPHGRSPAEMRHIRLSREDVSKTEPVQMCQALSRFFQEVDPVEDLLHRMLNGLKPPQIVVLGDESAGKSTILEQLAMLPFFPRKRRCCTRLAIHVRLRRTPGISRATLTVLNGKGEEQHWREIPQENGWLVVQEEMERLQEEVERSQQELDGSKAKKSERIIFERIIVVKVERGDVPCLDLVDLPGLVKLPKDKAEQVNKIYERQLQEDRSNGNQCMYLAVVPASGQARPNTNPVMEFIMEKGLQDRTFGIFSKCDENSDADVLRALTLNEKTEEDDEPAVTLGGVELPNGWVTTMQKPPNGEHFKYHNFERMYLQQKQEAEWFQNPDLPERKQHWQRLVEKKTAGIADLVPRVQKMYLAHLQSFWKEHAMLQIFEKEASTEFHLSMLGIVEDKEERKLLAKEEVQRRLGPDSMVTKQMYKSFVAEVLHKTVVNKVREILADFAVGQRCEGFEVPRLLSKKKEELQQLLGDVVAKMEACMVTEVGDILEAKSELCKDDPCDFNIKTGSLRLYHPGVYKSQWDVQERLKAKPIIQLCHFRDYLCEIMKNHCKMLEKAKARLRESVEKLIDRLVSRDFPSPYLEVTSSFLSQNDGNADYTDSCVIISCKIKQFLDDVLTRCYEHLPHPDRLQELYKDTPVGSETKDAKEECNRLKEELRLVRKAKDSVIRALAIEDEDLRRIKHKFEVEQAAKVEVNFEEGGKLCGGHGSQTGPQGDQYPGRVAEKVTPLDIEQSSEADVPDAAGPSQVEENHLLVASRDKIYLSVPNGFEKEVVAESLETANNVTPSGSGSWDPITSQSTPSSGDVGGSQLFDFDTLPTVEQPESKAHLSIGVHFLDLFMASSHGNR
eukprot:symbB.v1.2.036843.t1/scaffold5297.1/size28705/1